MKPRSIVDNINIVMFTFLPMLYANTSTAQETFFIADSAYAYTKHLSVNIGPRPMGSQNELLALNWAVQQFKRFGVDSAYIMKIKTANTRNQTVNTNSGIAIGIIKGKTDSSIVIGGHIDSSGNNVPGANDDASGTACVIELARVWSNKPSHYTLIFTAFGGEEQGLIGSRFFVDNFEQIDKVALMLQIDMAAVNDQLTMFIESGESQAPEWLVKNVLRIGKELNIKGLYYPTQFFSINNTIGGIGSDHQSFIDVGIPAIDFTTGTNESPIHTLQDKFEYVDKSALDRSGKLVNALISYYQKNRIPSPKSGNYVLWVIAGIPIFIPNLFIYIILIFSLILSSLVFIKYYLERSPENFKVRFSGFKVLIGWLLVVLVSQVGETVIQYVKEIRYPWFINIPQYLLLTAFCALLGVWIIAQLTRKWSFSREPFAYISRAIIFQITFILLLSFVSFRLALYPALTLLLFSAGLLISNPIVKSTFFFCAPIPIFKLMFNEVFTFLARSSAKAGIHMTSIGKDLQLTTIMTILLVLWYLPVIYFYSSTIVSNNDLKNLILRFRRVTPGIVIFSLSSIYGIYLYFHPAYSDKWKAELRVLADYNMTTQQSSFVIKSNEYLKNVEFNSDSLNKKYDSTKSQDSLNIQFSLPWLTFEGKKTFKHRAENDTVKVNWLLTSQKPWYKVNMQFVPDSGDIEVIDSNFAYKKLSKGISFLWYYDPPESLKISSEFVLTRGAKLIREVNAEYNELPISVNITADHDNIQSRTKVSYSDTLDFEKNL